MEILQKAKNEKELMAEQDTIKKYLICVAVYDMPKGYTKNDFGIPEGYTVEEKDKGKGYTASIFIHNYGERTEGYRLYLYKVK